MNSITEDFSIDQQINHFSELLKEDLSYKELVQLYDSIQTSILLNPKAVSRLKGILHKNSVEFVKFACTVNINYVLIFTK